MSSLVVADADGIIAQANPEDIHNKRADEIFIKLKNQNYQILYPITAVSEAATHIQRVLNNKPLAFHIAKSMLNADSNVYIVTEDILSIAVEFFSHTTSKKNTLFDCIVAAVAKKEQADAIFSFDTFYRSLGFQLVSDIVK